MHLLATETVTLDDTLEAVDLGLPAGDVLFLSYTDSDLAALAAAHRGVEDVYSLRSASLARLRHPLSVDLLVESLARPARLVVVRLLGGMDAWRYGVEELARAARETGVPLAIVPGCTMYDPRLRDASTVAEEDWHRLWAWFRAGDAANMAAVAGWFGARIGHDLPWMPPTAPDAFGRVEAACVDAGPAAPRAVLLVYRALVTADDVAPLVALAAALAGRGLSAETLYVSSLKDLEASRLLVAHLTRSPPAVIVNTTAFSARRDNGTTVLDGFDVPVLQAILSIGRRPAWEASPRGLGATDLAMNVVLPEVDGRIPTRAISFKADDGARVVHRPDPDGIAAVAALAARWAALRRTPNAAKRLALVIPDYPGRAGRAGRAVGLDTAASVAVIADLLRAEGYAVGDLPSTADLMRTLEAAADPRVAHLPLAAYLTLAAALPEPFRAAVHAAWGEPAGDFRFSILQAGRLVVALQPDRGEGADRAGRYHDPNLPPCHGFVAFHLWLRHVAGLDALIHLGTHGTLEWLPGKAVALSSSCAPAALTGDLPVIYPFIVNNPGEAAHARRRLSAVTIGHMTPPLTDAGQHGAGAELETLMDEYASARTLDARRARLVAASILTRARETGLADEAGLGPGMSEDAALGRLDAWLCDLKDMRIGDGLHVYGASADDASPSAACGRAERHALVAALAGRFVPPGPSGAPGATRTDVLPTGRNLYAVDPRAIPTATAYAIGRERARDVLLRHAQDQGDWPTALVIDLWGSSTMRTGGEDLAQGFALMGVRPTWDAATGRVTGFTVLPPAVLDHPRVDVTLRVSGLFRDGFPDQIALFDRAVQAIAALDEAADVNPLAARVRAAGATRASTYRVFGAAPGAYGVGIAARVNADDWASRDDLGASYLAAGGHAYGIGVDGATEAAAFAARVRAADAFVHVEDLAGRDVLDYDAFAEHEGGFAAAAASLGATPALYRADTSTPGPARVRTLSEDIARVVRARAANPRWIAGQMRHGHRGAAEIAETIDNLYALGVTARATDTRQFDLLFDATLGDATVRAFLETENPRAAAAMAETFRRAARRGLWHDRRNATAVVLADLAGEAR